LESAGRILLASIERLAAAGAEAVALTGVTAHAVLDIIRDRLPVPVLTIADAVAEDARRRGIRHAVLLGTLPTMRDDFFRKPLAEGGLATTVPAAMEQEFIEHCIETELEPGVVRAETREAVEEIAADLMEKADADAVILGCTELPLLWRDSPAPFPVINAAEVHAEALIRYILE
ncbi:aspartate/glutamate racemase family protein, partial [Sutterella sp.]|uniref:aspartate/glutamate racemase family protein n=1 Tax=Sutterella sp. TaxID=1981025 RepID=UPI0026DF0A43